MLTTDSIVKINLTINEAVQQSARYDAGLIIGKTAASHLGSDRVREYNSLQDMLDDEFGTSQAEYLAAAAYFAQQPAPERVFIGKQGAQQAVADAIAACFAETGEFWGVYVCGITQAQILLAEAYLSSIDAGMLFYTESDLATATGENGAFTVLQNRNSRRAAGLYITGSTYAGAAYMGMVAGHALANQEGSFSACYKTLKDVTPNSLATTAVTSVESRNASVYVTRGYRYNVLQRASTGSGLRVDEVLYLDALRADVRDAAVALIVGNARLPQTDATNTLFINAIASVLNTYLNRGILATGVWTGASIGTLETGDQLQNGYYVYIDSYANQSVADREAHKAMPVHIALHLAGSVESVEINIDVQR